MPRHPRPSSETARPWVPRKRFLSMLLLCTGERKGGGGCIGAETRRHGGKRGEDNSPPSRQGMEEERRQESGTVRTLWVGRIRARRGQRERGVGRGLLQMHAIVGVMDQEEDASGLG